MLVTCPECQKKLNVPDNAAGKKMRCPACKQVVAVPNAPIQATAPARRREAARVAPSAEANQPAPTLELAEMPEPVIPPAGTKPKSVMRCARCKAAALDRLPPNQFSRNPGYVCTACGANMRPPRTTVTYLFVILLGGFIVLLGVIPAAIALTADDHRGMLFVGAGSLVVLGFASAGWAGKQLFLPVPLDAPKRPSRLLFTLVVLFLGMLGAVVVIGGCLFGSLYYMEEMM